MRCVVSCGLSKAALAHCLRKLKRVKHAALPIFIATIVFVLTVFAVSSEPVITATNDSCGTTSAIFGLTNGRVLVNPEDFSYLIKSSPCKDENLVVAVQSALQNTVKRYLLRRTWANSTLLEKFFLYKAKVIFFVGATNSSAEQRALEFESLQYGDIVQASFIDSYKNNTYKALSLLRWISSPGGCPKATIIMKTDDDVQVHLARLNVLHKKIDGALKAYGSLFMMGNIKDSSDVTKVDRDPKSKWYIPHSTYPRDHFPPWFQGMVYIMPVKLAATVYRMSYNTTYMHTDDVYISLLVDGVRPLVHKLQITEYYTSYPWENKHMKDWTNSPRIFFHCFTFGLFMDLWNQSCSSWQACEDS